MSPEFEAGMIAFAAGKTEADNPYICGVTKFGNPKMTEEGHDWLAGFISAKPARVTGAAERAAADRLTNLGQFRKRYRRAR